MSRKFGLIGLAFWIYFFAAVAQWLTWMCQYLNNKHQINYKTGDLWQFQDFFSFYMLGHLFEFGGTFIFLMIIEMFNFVTLMYINKTG
jgi:hypothetical protein